MAKAVRSSILLALLAGGVAALGQAPVSFPWATMVGLVCIFAIFERTETPRESGWVGWWFGFGYFATALFWIIEPFLVDLPRYGWMAPFGLVGLAGGLAIIWGLALCGARWLAKGPWALALCFALGLSVAELARSYVLTGFPWALIGHVWIDWAPMQLAAWVGPHGLTFLTLVLVSLGAVAFRRTHRAGIATVSVFCLCLYVFAAWQGAKPIPTPAEIKVIRLVQPNAPQHLKWHPDHARGYFDRQVAYTAAMATRRPDLVIWPETSVPALLNHADYAIELIVRAADTVPVIIGIQRQENGNAYNSMVYLDANGVVSQIYDKHHLVPFGEYIPARSLLAASPFGTFVPGHGYAPGPGPRVLDLGKLGMVMPLICYEAIFPQDTRVAERPDWMLQITNDAWFGDWIGPYQHLAQARLRAVEQGLPMVRVANTGVSAVINAHGQITAHLGLGQAGFLDAALPGDLPPTLYAKTGDWAALIVYLLLGGAILRTRNKGRSGLALTS